MSRGALSGAVPFRHRLQIQCPHIGSGTLPYTRYVRFEEALYLVAAGDREVALANANFLPGYS
jgi:hypothetical protein